VSGKAATAKNGVVDGAISPGLEARSIGAALQQQPLDTIEVSHDDVNDDAEAAATQQLCAGIELTSARAAQLADSGNTETANISNANRRIT
jgi:hypothetical protein